MKTAVVLLAAGSSRRFGGNKLLERIEGRPMYLHIADEIDRMEEEEKIFAGKYIVTRYEEIEAVMKNRGYQVIRNCHSDRGISWSVRLGTEAAEKEEAICFAVCDQPYLTRETIKKFLKEWEQSGKGMGCVGYGGQLGNPAVFSSKYFEELKQLSGDRGGKALFCLYPEDVYIYRTKNQKELEDIDIRRTL